MREGLRKAGVKLTQSVLKLTFYAFFFQCIFITLIVNGVINISLYQLDTIQYNASFLATSAAGSLTSSISMIPLTAFFQLRLIGTSICNQVSFFFQSQ